MKNSWVYLLIVFALFLGINAPSLFSEGMFMDGLLYATISRNLAEGKGSFWDLFVSETYNAHFQGHPPLAMGLESIFFSVFGDSILIERFYSLFTILISGLLIVKIWLLLTDREIRQLYWLPLLFLTTIGVVGWSVSNNMLENTMLVFILLSFYFILKSLFSKDNIKLLLYLLLAGFSLFFGFLTKGFVALFPLMTLFYYWLFTSEISFYRGVRDSIILFISFLIPFAIIYFFIPEGVESLTNYYYIQVEASLNKTEASHSRYWIIGSLFQQLIPSFILIIIALLFAGKQKYYHFSNISKVLLAIGFSGVLPMLISLKQRDFYIVGAYPFFVLSISLFLAPLLKTKLAKLELNRLFTKRLKIFSLVLAFISITITIFQFGRIGRDEGLIHDVKVLRELLKPNAVLLVSPSLASNWALKGYFARYLEVGVTINKDLDFYYLIKDTVEYEEGFERVDKLDLKKLVLYRKLESVRTGIDKISDK